MRTVTQVEDSVQKPHPPLWIGGRGPIRTLRTEAKHADVWNTSGGRGFDTDMEALRILEQLHRRGLEREALRLVDRFARGFVPLLRHAS